MSPAPSRTSIGQRQGHRWVDDLLSRAEGTDTTRMPACTAAEPRSQSSRRGIWRERTQLVEGRSRDGQVASQHVGEVQGRAAEHPDGLISPPAAKHLGVQTVVVTQVDRAGADGEDAAGRRGLCARPGGVGRGARGRHPGRPAPRCRRARRRGCGPTPPMAIAAAVAAALEDHDSRRRGKREPSDRIGGAVEVTVNDHDHLSVGAVGLAFERGQQRTDLRPTATRGDDDRQRWHRVDDRRWLAGERPEPLEKGAGTSAPGTRAPGPSWPTLPAGLGEGTSGATEPRSLSSAWVSGGAPGRPAAAVGGPLGQTGGVGREFSDRHGGRCAPTASSTTRER